MNIKPGDTIRIDFDDEVRILAVDAISSDGTEAMLMDELGNIVVISIVEATHQ